jgi:hypothetical protein
MSGGLVQLVALGAQDAYLTGDPKVSFFRSNYQRHTHFSGVTDRQLIQGVPTAGGISTLRFERKGDLLSYVYLNALGSSGTIQKIAWKTIIDKVELLIGGQIVDTQDFAYMDKIDPVLLGNTWSKRYNGDNLQSCFFPLKFFFCKDWQSALPLVALQYHDVEVRITWSSSLGTSVPEVFSGASVAGNTLQYQAYARYIFLDKAEREYFSKSNMDILIEQVQRVLLPPAGQDKAEIVISHPVKFITASNLIQTHYSNVVLKQQINGVDVADFRPLPLFAEATQYYHTPYGYISSGSGYDTNTSNVLLVPFCLDTSKLQPTGTMNFSRIDSYRLIVSGTMSDGKSATWDKVVDSGFSNYFYAVNYNILRIMNGMGALLYAN